MAKEPITVTTLAEMR
jgi:CBS domain-containing protein